MSTRTLNGLSLVTAAGVVLGVTAPVAAQEDPAVAALTKPSSTASVGGGWLSDDAPISGQYNGRDKKGWYYLGDFDVRRRVDETGTWIRFRTRDLGLESREIFFEHERQGDWKYNVEYNMLPRYESYTVNTGLSGNGTTEQTVNGAAMRDLELVSKRERITVEAKKFLPRNFDFRVKFRNEERDGSRLFGQGYREFYFLTEPLDSTTQQVDAVLSYSGERFQAAGGYYGSFFDQHKNRIDVIGGVAQRGTPIANPPGNQAHQVYLNGGYSFTPTTRGTFKVKYQRTFQDENFVAPSRPGRTDADAGLDTFAAKVGMTSRPVPKLSLIADFGYEDRDERTPVEQYIDPGSTHDGTNVPHSRRRWDGKFEASYALPMGYRATGGVYYEQTERSVPDVRAVVYRKRNGELSFRGELQKSLSETVNGRVSYTYSDKGGSDFLPNFTTSGGLGSNLVNPLHFADRTRHKVRGMVDWMPAEPLSLQFVAAYSADYYGGENIYGPKEGSAVRLSADAAYAINDEWSTTAWYSFENIYAKSESARSGVERLHKLDNTSHAFGVGVNGELDNGIELGADFAYSFDRGKFDQTALQGPDIPRVSNVYYRHANVNFYAKYALRSNVVMRLDYAYDRWDNDDWQWENFAFDDGTIVSRPDEKNHFIGLSASYRFR
jgi:MtrB/PioB family decaheme-associated outer membrane protein